MTRRGGYGQCSGSRLVGRLQQILVKERRQIRSQPSPHQGPSSLFHVNIQGYGTHRGIRKPLVLDSQSLLHTPKNDLNSKDNMHLIGKNATEYHLLSSDNKQLLNGKRILKLILLLIYSN